MMKNTPKIAVIGLDGCSPKYLEKILSHGFAPTIKQIVSKHGYFKLYAFPPCTPPSWSSIMSGVNPGKHGIYGFQHYDKATGRTYLTSALHLEHPRVHEMLGINGLKSIVINPIPSYPLIPVKNTLIISHMFFTPRLVWYPRHIGKYAKLLSEHSYRSSTREEYLENVANTLDNYLALVESLIDRFDWSLFWLNLHYPDAILHKFDEKWVFEKQYYFEDKIFGKIDRIVKIMLRESDYLVIVSDHGFSHYHTIININSFLFRRGYAVEDKEGKGLREFWEHGENKDYLGISNRLVLRIANNKLFSKMIPPIKNLIEKITGKKIRTAEYNVDVGASKAFLLSTYSHGIILNDTLVKERLVSELKTLEGIAEVRDSTEIYDGPYIGRAPDLLVFPDYDSGYCLGKNKITSIVYRRKEVNNHHPIGIFILSGPIEETSGEAGANIVPNHVVANIIMLLLNQPLSNHADSIELAEKIVGRKNRGFKDYVRAWRLFRRIATIESSGVKNHRSTFLFTSISKSK